MPTVLDSLVVELGLDPDKFAKGIREALGNFKKVHEEAKSRGTEVERTMKHSLETFSKIRNQVLLLTAAFLGGRSIKEFEKYITDTDAAMGRFSRNFAIPVRELNKWQVAVQQFGGSAETVYNSFQRFSDQIQAAYAGRPDAEWLAMLRRLAVEGGHAIDITRPVAEQFIAVSDNLRVMAEKSGTVRAGWFARQLGIDPALLPILLGNARKILDESQKLKGTTEADTLAAESRLKAWTGLAKAAERVGEMLATWSTPGIIAIVTKLTHLLQMWAGEKTPETGAGSTENLRQRFGDPSKTPLGRMLGLPPTHGDVWDEVGQQLSIKPGAGKMTPATAALASSLMGSIGGIDRFTSFMDAFHTAGAHAAGTALDFTLKDKSRSAEVAAAIRSQLAARGIDATVLDEYLKPSKNATGGHIHVQLNNPAQAPNLSQPPAGFGAATNPAAGGKTSMIHSETNISQLTVNTQATDADGIARDIKPAIERARYAMLSNYSVA